MFFTCCDRACHLHPARLRRPRLVGARVCNRCGHATQALRSATSSWVPWPPLEAVTQSWSHSDQHTTPGLLVELPPVELLGRLSLHGFARFTGYTLLHVTSSCRLRMIGVDAQCWQGTIRAQTNSNVFGGGRFESDFRRCGFF